jgi:ABC-type transporter Mla subunit MlaD
MLLAIFVAASKAAKSLKEEIEEIRFSMMPTVHRTRELVDRLSPRVEQTVTDVAALAQTLRAQAEDMEAAVTEVLARVRKETGRVDTMFSKTLDALDSAGMYVTQTVGKPVRQISGLLAGIKAMIESLNASAPSHREPLIHDDKDMFV